jgi:hypothetical protein
MIDPVTASNDRLQDTGRWGYTGELIEDPVSAPVEESAGASRWLLWVAILAVVVIALFALFGGAI